MEKLTTIPNLKFTYQLPPVSFPRDPRILKNPISHVFPRELFLQKRKKRISMNVFGEAHYQIHLPIDSGFISKRSRSSVLSREQFLKKKRKKRMSMTFLEKSTTTQTPKFTYQLIPVPFPRNSGDLSF